MTDKTLVIGGLGAIGLNLVKYLLEKNVQVEIIDNLSSSHKNLESLGSANLSIIDITDKDKITKKIYDEKPNYIYNLAAHFANQNSVDFPYEDIATNIIGQINILEACKEISCLKKYVYASSSCVYGSKSIMSEDDNIYPYETPYAINKYVGELYTKYYSEQFNVPAISVRIFNTFGMYEFAGEYRNAIPNFIERAIKNQDIVITGSGEETRDFTYVEDTISCLYKACSSDYVAGEVFNSGTGKEVKVINLAKKIIKLTNSKSKITFVKKRSWDDIENRKSDISKSAKLLDYTPHFSLEEGLIKTINWYKEQRF